MMPLNDLPKYLMMGPADVGESRLDGPTPASFTMFWLPDSHYDFAPETPCPGLEDNVYMQHLRTVGMGPFGPGPPALRDEVNLSDFFGNKVTELRPYSSGKWVPRSGWPWPESGGMPDWSGSIDNCATRPGIFFRNVRERCYYGFQDWSI